MSDLFAFVQLGFRHIVAFDAADHILFLLALAAIYRGKDWKAVLWVITALTALTGAGMLVARLGSETTRNRVLLARAEWAREACGEILQARFAKTPAIRALEPIDLGRGTWCRAWLDDPAAKANLNTTDGAALAQLFASLGVPRTFADSVLARRKQGTVYDLRQINGLDSAAIDRKNAQAIDDALGRVLWLESIQLKLVQLPQEIKP